MFEFSQIYDETHLLGKNILEFYEIYFMPKNILKKKINLHLIKIFLCKKKYFNLDLIKSYGIKSPDIELAT